MKPVLLTVDDDPLVLVAIERDLKHQYSNRFLLLQADSISLAGLHGRRPAMASLSLLPC